MSEEKYIGQNYVHVLIHLLLRVVAHTHAKNEYHYHEEQHAHRDAKNVHFQRYNFIIRTV